MAKLPAFQFYSGDWLKDPELAMCSPATRGIWIDALCAMHASATFALTGTAEQLARVCRCTVLELHSAVEDLKTTNTAFIRERDGKVTILSRRFEREHKERENNYLRKQKWRRNRFGTEDGEGCHTPSSSSPSSSSSRLFIKSEKKASKVPEAFAPDPEMLEWALREGFTPEEVSVETPAMIDHFVGTGGVKRDWRATWRNWMRNSRKFGGKNGTSGRNLSTGDKIQRSINEIAAWGESVGAVNRPGSDGRNLKDNLSFSEPGDRQEPIINLEGDV